MKIDSKTAKRIKRFEVLNERFTDLNDSAYMSRMKHLGFSPHECVRLSRLAEQRDQALKESREKILKGLNVPKSISCDRK